MTNLHILLDPVTDFWNYLKHGSNVQNVTENGRGVRGGGPTQV